MDILHVDELHFPVGNGATIPLRGTISGNDYIIKTFNNVESNKTLVNELVCYLISKQLNLPIPDATIGVIDTKTLIHSEVSSLEGFSEKCYGLCFCSKVLNLVTNPTSAKMIKASSNYEWLLPKLMLFDHLIYNKDRNKGNLLMSLSKKDNKLYIIDHSHTFNLETLWNSIYLEQKINDNDYMDTRIMESNAYFYSKFKEILKIDSVVMYTTINYFKENLSYDFFKKVIDEVPSDWENDKNELITLSDYLIYRMEHLNNFAEIIISNNYRR